MELNETGQSVSNMMGKCNFYALTDGSWDDPFVMYFDRVGELAEMPQDVLDALVSSAPDDWHPVSAMKVWRDDSHRGMIGIIAYARHRPSRNKYWGLIYVAPEMLESEDAARIVPEFIYRRMVKSQKKHESE